MARVYLASDPHLGHVNMAKKRGFEDINEHDEYIINRWNETVNKNDKIYLLGDITMETAKHYPLLKRLKGNIVVVGGNHDKPGHVKELLKYVSGVAGAIKYKGFILTHIPIHPRELDLGRFKGNIHGHVHEDEIADNRYVCVSMECTDYKPELFTDISEIFE